MRRGLGLGLLALSIVLVGAGCQRVQSNRDAFPQPHVGSSGVFQEYPRWQVSGRVTVKDERTLQFDDFFFYGDKLTAYVMLLKDRKNLGILKELTGQRYEGASFDLALPDNVRVEDFNLVVIFSPDIGAPVSGVKFDPI